MLAVDLYCLGMRKAIVRPATNEITITRARVRRWLQSNDARVAQCLEAVAFRLVAPGAEMVVLISTPNVVGRKVEA
jgi:hypothetical protein